MIFRCEGCGCAENTALCRYWTRKRADEHARANARSEPALCSECDPKIGKWHGRFKKVNWIEYCKESGTKEGKDKWTFLD